MKDIHVTTIFARMFTATASALTTDVDRPVTPSKHVVVKQVAGASYIQIPNDPAKFLDQPTAKNASSISTAPKQGTLFSEGGKGACY